MKHLLIPTDFSISSLNAVHAALEKYQNEKLKITFLHLLNPSNDISDMLFAYKRNEHHKLVSEQFKEAYQILQNRHSSRIEAIKVKFGFGNTAAYLENLLIGEQIDSVICCPDITLSSPSPKSVNMLPLLSKTKFPLDVIACGKTRVTHTDIELMNMRNTNGLRVPKTEESYVTEK